MKNIILMVLFSILFSLCSCSYFVDSISFQNENYSKSANPYDIDRYGRYSSNIIPIEYDNKGFIIDFRNSHNYIRRSYHKKSSLFWLKDNSFIINIIVYIYSIEELDNIEIKKCEIIFNDNIVEFDDTELSIFEKDADESIGTNENEYRIKYFRNYIIIEKEIDIKLLNKNIENILTNNENNQFITVKINLNYNENGEIKNWVGENKFYLNKSRAVYSHKNMWGGLP